MTDNKKIAIARLKKLFRGKDKTVYVIQKHVSQSGTLRILELYIIRKNTPIRISNSVSEILGWKMDESYYGVRVHGCGMDMHFHTVYSLSAELYGLKNKGAYKLEYKTL